MAAVLFVFAAVQVLAAQHMAQYGAGVHTAAAHRQVTPVKPDLAAHGAGHEAPKPVPGKHLADYCGLSLYAGGAKALGADLPVLVLAREAGAAAGLLRALPVMPSQPRSNQPRGPPVA